MFPLPFLLNLTKSKKENSPELKRRGFLIYRRSQGLNLIIKILIVVCNYKQNDQLSYKMLKNPLNQDLLRELNEFWNTINHTLLFVLYVSIEYN